MYDEDETINLLDIRVFFFLDGNLNVYQLTRYNFWDLLGDVGGFRDGIILVF